MSCQCSLQLYPFLGNLGRSLIMRCFRYSCEAIERRFEVRLLVLVFISALLPILTCQVIDYLMYSPSSRTSPRESGLFYVFHLLLLSRGKPDIVAESGAHGGCHESDGHGKLFGATYFSRVIPQTGSNLLIVRPFRFVGYR